MMGSHLLNLSEIRNFFARNLLSRTFLFPLSTLHEIKKDFELYNDLIG